MELRADLGRPEPSRHAHRSPLGKRARLLTAPEVGRVIALNGTTSAGKSTLAREMQAQLAAEDECWIIVGIDDFLGKLPQPWVHYFEVGAHADDGVSFTRRDDEIVFRAGPVGRALLTAYRRSTAVVVRSGVDVIVDDVLVDQNAWVEWEAELRSLDPFWVRVSCPVEVCEERERARGDRLVGLARSQASVVHRFARYDFTVDTSAATPAELARAVIDAHRGRAQPQPTP